MVRAGGALLLALTLAYEISLAARSGSGFTPLWDVLVLNVGLGLATALLWMRVPRDGPSRGVFIALAAAISAYTVATTIYAATTWLVGQPDTPSIADVGYLACNVLLGVAIALQMLRSRGSLPPTVLLDVLMGALGASAGVAVLTGPVLQTDEAATIPALLTAAAYPVSDIALIGAAIGLLALPRTPESPNWVLVTCGIGVFVLADVIFTLQIAAGDYTFGEPADGLWMIGIAIITLAVWLPSPPVPEVSTNRRWMLAAPIAALTVAIGVLVLGSITSIPRLAVVLAALCLAVAVLRTVLSFRDLRRLVEAQELATTDALTGLHNRRYAYDVMKVLADTLPRDALLVVLVVDIDRFKAVNDRFGHAAGDATLQQVAGAIARTVRPHDIAARLGGDEFLVATVHPAPSTSSALAAGRAVATHIRQAIADGRETGGPISVSIGVAVGPSPGESVAGLIARADDQMYQEKRRRRR